MSARGACASGPRGRPAARRTARSWRCSRAGATRSACSTSRSRCAAGRRAGAARQLRPARAGRRGRAPLPRRCASGSGCELEVVRGRAARRAPSPRPAARATCRRGRASCATRRPQRLAEGSDALIATGHTASDQVETILYRLAASPGRRALLGMVASEGRLIRPLLGVTREQTAAYCEARGLALARGREQRRRALRARARAPRAAAGAARGASGGGGQRAAHRRAAARGDRAARRRSWPTSWRARDSIAIARLRDCRRRSRAWWWCAWPRRPRAPSCRRRATAWRRSSRSPRAAAARSCTSAGQAGAVIEGGVLRDGRSCRRAPD